MSRFRTRTITIEAIQYREAGKTIHDVIREYRAVLSNHERSGGLCAAVETLEGMVCLTDGDWIVTGARGERYPLHPDVFNALYEPDDAPTPEPAKEISE